MPHAADAAVISQPAPAHDVREFAIGHLEELARRLALPRTKRAVHLSKHIVIGRHVLQDAVVVLHVRAPEQQMHARVLAVAPRTAAHLIELDLVVRQLEEHDVADVGNVHALAERRRGHEHRDRARAEQLFDARALGARKARVVEADERCHLWHAFAQVAGERHRLLARGHVDDALLALRDERRPGSRRDCAGCAGRPTWRSCGMVSSTTCPARGAHGRYHW